jgi:hypothetical protein
VRWPSRHCRRWASPRPTPWVTQDHQTAWFYRRVAATGQKPAETRRGSSGAGRIQRLPAADDPADFLPACRD